MWTGTMKFMVLFFYRRCTCSATTELPKKYVKAYTDFVMRHLVMVGTFQMKLIKYYFWMCAVTYVGVFLTVTFGCHP